MADADRCWTCGRLRGIALRREHWTLGGILVYVPRTGNPNDKPVQQINDLVVTASVRRNGGSSEATHVCDECLRIGLRQLKVEVDKRLCELDIDHDIQSENTMLASRLSACQSRCFRMEHVLKRMQSRLRDFLVSFDRDDVVNKEAVAMCRWEVEHKLEEEIG